MLAGGERGGKSYATFAIALPHVVMLPVIRRERFYDEHGKLRFDEKKDRPRTPDVVIFGPTYAEPKIEFEYLQQALEQLGMLAGGLNKPSKPQDGPWVMVTKAGVVISTRSMEDPTSIRAIDLEFAIIAEAGKCPYDGVERVQGRISAKRGFIIYSGTMENSHQWYQDWVLMGQRENHLGIKSYSLPTWGNIHEYPGGREDPEIKRLEAIYPEDTFAMRVAAEPRPPRYRVLQEVTTEHVVQKRVPKDATWEVWVDPGYASAYAVLFVAHWNETAKDGAPLGKRFYVADELYEQGRTTRDIIALCKRHRLWPRVSAGVIDIGAKGHRDAGESALEIWNKLTSFNWNMKLWREPPLMERIRSSAQQFQFWINPSCVGLIAECGLGEPVFPEMHPWKYPTDRSGRVLGEKPIDKWNHSSKALGYGLLHHLGQVERSRQAMSISRLKSKQPVRSAFAAA